MYQLPIFRHWTYKYSSHGTWVTCIRLENLNQEFLPQSLSQASLVQHILALCSQRQFLSTGERKGSDVAKKKQLKLILLTGQGLAHSECVGWRIFLKWKNPAVEDYWSQTRRYLNCVDIEHSILKVFQNLSSLISSQLLHICCKEAHTSGKTEKRGRWGSNWLHHNIQEFHIN